MFLAESGIQILDYAARGGLVLFLYVVLYGGYKGWWMYGPSCERIIKDKDNEIERERREKQAWMQTALKSAGVAFALSEEKRRDAHS